MQDTTITKPKKKRRWLPFVFVGINVAVIVIMAISVGSIGVFSTVFMEKFYTNKKQAAIKEVYKTLQEIVAKDPDLEDSKNSSKLNSICETDGATLIIVDVSGQSVYSYGPGKNLADRWASLVYGKNINGNKGTVIESKKDYTLQYMVDSKITLALKKLVKRHSFSLDLYTKSTIMLWYFFVLKKSLKNYDF